MFLKALAYNLLDQKASIQCVAVHPGIVTTNLVINFFVLALFGFVNILLFFFLMKL